MFIYPYHHASRSAKALAEGLNARRIKHRNSRFRGGRNTVVVNWGASQIDNPRVLGSLLLNDPRAVGLVANKLSFFRHLQDYPRLVPWTDRREVAEDWIRDGHTAVARTLLRSHSGRGIVLADTVDALPDARLYTRYVKKKDEYRVHVVNGQVVDLTRKARIHEHDDPNWKIRTRTNGFTYARGDINPGDPLVQGLMWCGLEMIAHLGLDFGCVDILHNEREQRLYVVEVNSAPGLEGTTLEKYVDAFVTNWG